MTDVEMEGVKEEVKTEAVEAVNGSNNNQDELEEDSGEYSEESARKHLLTLELQPPLIDSLIKLYNESSMRPSDVDERAMEMLKTFPADQVKYLVEQLVKSKLFGVQNKAQYLMSIMRNLKDRVRQLGASFVLSSPLIQGPSQADMQAILDRTGYKLEVTVGQRKYGGPPPDWEGPATGPVGNGHEIYIGHIPHDMYEDKLVPLFEEVGKIWDLRLMMDPISGQNRGYAFLTYCDKAFAAEAAKKLDGHEIAPGKQLKVNVSIANTRLFIGNIPKSKSKEEILAEFQKNAEGVIDVIIYTNPDANEKNKNRGFCFVDFVDHKAASDAKRKIQTSKSIRPFNCELVVDWAEQQEEPDEETMSKVKVVYVRNLKEAQTEETLKTRFEQYGKIERVKKIKDYAFVHYEERESAVKAIDAENGQEVDGVKIDVSLAKPLTENKKKKPSRGRGFGRGMGGPFGGGDYGRGMGRGAGGPGMYGGRGYGDYFVGGGYGGGGPYGGMGGPGGYGGGYGDFGGGYGYGGYDMGGGRGGRGGGGFDRGRGGRGGGGRGRGRGFGRGAGKRPGDWAGGPASKRPEGPDFAADVMY